ncbi:Rqc2 family fibronectin-binding protein [Paenibacillus polymyxa]|uniref:Rqc2 family fibronectin-binding protein n=1 Tax=Paenibacillus polymyxa TaxID=1406 RepID=UPI0025B6E0B4|nr:NFACT RNA binding domain-containing protein [Paenibacillus polymyxa]MDN4082276.1 NFACT RNA binding domain-containing protein [Paenibacillus polymyxa]MDN4088159.1 NFACT RNA binding domain-containing protein [Paenibacillus polymyxa]MDN4107608.1 NFACT RNA binding domain-containing protein [Paenibacillus polymyxa]
MALDGIVTRAIVHELQAIRGGRINKIHQPNERDIVLNLRAQGGSVKLLLSANPTFPRVHFTEQSFLNPTEAPMFCMLLRKHCEGGIIENITQVGMERIIHMNIRQRDELGDISLKRIIIEVMGRHSNIILLDPETGMMLDGIHHVTPSISSYRVVMPGFQYTEPPEQNKLNPLEVEEAAFISSYQAALEAEEAPKRWLVNTFTGLSPLIAEEILIRASNEEASGDKDRRLWRTFSDIMDDVRNHRFQPVSGLNAQDKVIFSAIPLTLIEGERKEYATISECMEDFFGEKAERDTVKQKVSDLLRFLQNERSKNVKKLDHLHQDLAEAEDADQFRIYGELLFASLHEVKKGDKEVTLTNFYDEEQGAISIPLDPLLNPSDNAQRYFKKYNKYKNSLAVIDEQLAKTHEEIRYMDNLLQQLAHASINDIEEIREELVQQGYLRDRVKKGKKKKKNDRPTLHVYTSSEGIELLVGKNNLQNEYVTNRLAGPNDTWLHTKDIPGSHVVIRAEKFGDATLEEAAQLAAYFSQAKQSSSVPVDATLIRYVRKPSGAKPGFVIYDHQRTLFITPDEELVKKLPNRIKNG